MFVQAIVDPTVTLRVSCVLDHLGPHVLVVVPELDLAGTLE